LASLDAERRSLDNHDKATDTALKSLYAKVMLWILAAQLLTLNAVFIAAGLRCLAFDGSTLKLYMGGTLAEVFGVILVITKYLFPKKK
jgi:hypothetical protein